MNNLIYYFTILALGSIMRCDIMYPSRISRIVLFGKSFSNIAVAIRMQRGLERAKCRRRFGTKVVSVGVACRPISGAARRRPTTREQSVYVTAPLCSERVPVVDVKHIAS